MRGNISARSHFGWPSDSAVYAPSAPFSGCRLHRLHLSCLITVQGAGAKAGAEVEEGAECMALTQPKQICPLEASVTQTTAMLPQGLLQPPAHCSSRHGPSQLMLLVVKVTGMDSKCKATAGCVMLLHASCCNFSRLVNRRLAF